jgi:hypothetical protein
LYHINVIKIGGEKQVPVGTETEEQRNKKEEEEEEFSDKKNNDERAGNEDK